MKNVKSGKEGLNISGNGGGNMPAGGPGPDAGNYRDRSPIRRREFDLPMRGREPDMPPRGREPDMMMRGGPPQHEMDRGPRDFDGRDHREWGRDQLDMMDPYPGDPYRERERDMHPRDPFLPAMGDHRGGYG